MAGSASRRLDPAKVTAQGGESLLYHLYENLLRWEDDGAGWGKLAPGQAETWTVDTDYAGGLPSNVTVSVRASTAETASALTSPVSCTAPYPDTAESSSRWGSALASWLPESWTW